MAYREEQKLKIKGIYNSPNQFSEIPDGSLSRAINVVLTRDSICETRRGFGQYGYPVANESVEAIFSYKDKLIAWGTDNKLYLDSVGDGSVWTAYTGTFAVPDSTIVGSRIRSFQSNKNFYFTTSNGVFKLDDTLDTPIPAGAPPALGGTASLTGSSGFMANNTAVAYRIVWGYRDSNDNLILSAPSDRIVVVNTSGGSRNVNITFTVPSSSYIDTTWFYQVYRSDASADATSIPGDDYQQVIEGNPTATQLTNRQVTVSDIIPDELRQAYLYSSGNQEGATNANYNPPFCKDACSYKNFAFYANTREPHSLKVTLLAVGPSLGLQIGDTVTFTDANGHTFTLTGAASENVTTGAFLVQTSGSASQNNEATARSICSVINLYAANTFLNGFYTSTFDDLQGQMKFEMRKNDTVNFTLVSSRTTCWSPTIPSSGSTASNTSTNNTFPNRVYVSKLQQPEAVPVTNYFDIGSASEPIGRILSHRDAVFVFKTDGIYSISGDDLSNFRVNTLDNTAIVLAPNTVTTLNNSVYYYSTQGLCRIGSSGGVEILSIPVEKELLELSSSNYPNFPELSFAVGYESDRTYSLHTVSTPSDSVCTQQFHYNVLTNAWTKSDRASKCALVNPVDNKLYIGGQLSNTATVWKERKTGVNTDYADEEFLVTIVSASGLEIVLSSLTNVSVDQTIQQGSVASIITDIDANTNTITVSDLDVWAAGTASVFNPIRTRVTTAPITAGTPNGMKHFPEVSLFFENPNFDDITVLFASDFNSTSPDVVLHPSGGAKWGEGAWGDNEWGGGNERIERLRTFVPKSAQRCNWLAVDIQTNQCFISFALCGLAIMSNYQGFKQKN